MIRLFSVSAGGQPAFHPTLALTTPTVAITERMRVGWARESNSTGRNRPVLPCYGDKGNYQAKVTTPQIGHRAQLQAEST